MYIDIFKVLRVFLYLLGVFAISVGLFLFVLSKTPQEQLVGIATAQFGLVVVWFIAWLGRGSKPTKNHHS